MKRPLILHLWVAAIISLGGAGCLTITAPPCGPVTTAKTVTTPSLRTTPPTTPPAARPSAGQAVQPVTSPTSGVPSPSGPPPTAPAPVGSGATLTSPPPPTSGVKSPHPADWLTQHGLQVKAAGGVDKATIAGGISCATCHTTAMSPDGTVAHSPVATYTCFSCHNGPNGPNG